MKVKTTPIITAKTVHLYGKEKENKKQSVIITIVAFKKVSGEINLSKADITKIEIMRKTILEKALNIGNKGKNQTISNKVMENVKIKERIKNIKTL